jgi:hypothetical protein
LFFAHLRLLSLSGVAIIENILMHKNLFATILTYLIYFFVRKEKNKKFLAHIIILANLLPESVLR